MYVRTAIKKKSYKHQDMYEHNLTWEEWTERFFAASDYQVDRTGISEKEAEDRYPIFYDSYLNGDEPEDFYCQYFVSHERGEVEIWFDPDDPNYYDEELDAILSNTEFYETFNLEMSNLKLLNNVSINNSVTDMDITINQTFRRQIYVGVVTCLETYLSDAFINTVLSNEEYLELFFKTFKFTKPKIDTKDLFKISKNIRDFAGKRMLEVLYHNIEKVKVMYKNTLSVSFPETEKKSVH